MPDEKDLKINNTVIKEYLALKQITDIVAYKIFESPENMGTEANYAAAYEVVSHYIDENYTDLDMLKSELAKLYHGEKSTNKFADTIYSYYLEKQLLNFEVVKDIISKGMDSDLKKITDIVAYKIYQSPENKGSELNFLSAETFVAHYISENFKTLHEFKNKLAESKNKAFALEEFARVVYEYYFQYAR